MAEPTTDPPAATPGPMQSAVVQLDRLRDSRFLAIGPVRALMYIGVHSVIIFLSLFFALGLRLDFAISLQYQQSLWRTVVAAIIVKTVVFMVLRLHSGMWRYTNLADAKRIVLGNLVASAATTAVVLGFWDWFYWYPRSSLVLDLVFCTLLMLALRVTSRSIRELAEANLTQSAVTRRTVLVGSCDNCSTLMSSLRNDRSTSHVVGIIATDGGPGRSVGGVPILARADDGPGREAAIARVRPDMVLLVPPHTGPMHLSQMLDSCESAGVIPEFKTLPTMRDLVTGDVAVDMIRDVSIEDLLGRTPAEFERDDVKARLTGRVVMVTGGGGSIGSELCRQIALYQPSRLVIFESSEFNLFQIHRELVASHADVEIVPVAGDIRMPQDLDLAIGTHKPDVLYHAAAYKHVHMMEVNVRSALLNNVRGTANVLAACQRHGVGRMVMISSDKAVRPTSVMGATKRLAELVILGQPRGGTEVATVRFGNVLGSSGSVIPLFREQIARGGPVTVTSPDVTRFFMLIPEAVDLVLQASAIGEDREVMVLEMGQPVKIVDLAHRMIELSGLTPGVDIDIEFIGLRPGEKEYEELLTADENVVRTPWDRICVARDPSDDLPDPTVILAELETLLAGTPTPADLRTFIESYVPLHNPTRA